MRKPIAGNPRYIGSWISGGAITCIFEFLTITLALYFHATDLLWLRVSLGTTLMTAAGLLFFRCAMLAKILTKWPEFISFNVGFFTVFLLGTAGSFAWFLLRTNNF